MTEITELDAISAEHHLGALADVLFDCVEGGASVSFMWPFERREADDYWSGVIESLGEKRLRLFAAIHDNAIRGSVQLWLDGPCNQKHRGDIRKLLVHRTARRLGLARGLMQVAEEDARKHGLSLLTLDTVTESPAETLYGSLGWQRVGVIPRFAKWPDGRFCDTTVMYKSLA